MPRASGDSTSYQNTFSQLCVTTKPPTSLQSGDAYTLRATSVLDSVFRFLYNFTHSPSSLNVHHQFNHHISTVYFQSQLKTVLSSVSSHSHHSSSIQSALLSSKYQTSINHHGFFHLQHRRSRRLPLPYICCTNKAIC
jgi:hypothetical protein